MKRKRKPRGFGLASGVTITLSSSGTEEEALLLLETLESISKKIEESLKEVDNTEAKITHSDL